MPTTPAPGLIKGLGVTFEDDARPAHVTVAVPPRQGGAAPRARGVIALKEENCTVCMLCARQCPDWCIYIEGHKERRRLAAKAASRARSTSSTASTSTTRSACTAASASRCARSTRCSGAPSTSTPSRSIADLLHDKERLGEWMETVPEPLPLEVGAAEEEAR